MKLRARSVLALVALTLLVTAPRAIGEEAKVPCAVGALGSYGSTCDKRLTWRFDGARRAFIRAGKLTLASGLDANRYVYRYTGRCEGQSNCRAAMTCDGGIRYNVSAYLILPDGSVTSVPPLVDTICVYPDVIVPATAVTAAAHEEIRKRITAPTVTSAPPGKTLVNIITIYSTQPQPEPRIDITTPVPGSIIATPEYRWDFGDGQTALGPGLPYQHGDDPAQLPGKYLGPTWRTGGTKHVTLTVTWRVQFRLEGVIDVPLDPIVFTATQDKTVATARAVLVQR